MKLMRAGGRPRTGLVGAAMALLWLQVLPGCGDKSSSMQDVSVPDAGADSLGADTRGDEGGVGGEGQYTVCDGSSSVRLAFVDLPNLSRIMPGEAVIVENGARYLFVDGSCRYWAFPGSRLNQPPDHLIDIRTGSLSNDDVRGLSRSLEIDRWKDWAGEHIFAGALGDATPTVLWIKGTQVSCQSCFTKLPDLREVVEAAGSALDRLYDSGKPVEGGVRMAAVSAQEKWGADWKYGSAPWPLMEDIGKFVVRGDQPGDRGQGFAVDPPGADRLRQARRDTRDGKYAPNFGPQYVPVTDSAGLLYFLFVRDTLPFERRSDGLVPWPPG